MIDKEPEPNKIKMPYYDKGGHWLRSQYWGVQKKLGEIVPELTMRNIQWADLPVQEAQRIRRHMPRYGKRDGR